MLVALNSAYCPLSVILSHGGTALSLLSCLPVVLPPLCYPVSRWYCPLSVILSQGVILSHGGTALSLLSCLPVVLNLCIGVLHPCVHPTTFMVALIYFNKIHTCTFAGTHTTICYVLVHLEHTKSLITQWQVHGNRPPNKRLPL